MDTRFEQKAMKINFSLSLFFGLFGVIWGISINSQAVVLDGLYASIGVLLSSFGIYTTKKMAVMDEENFPFGKSQMEPLLVLLFSATIITICIMAFLEALSTFLSGGRDVNPLSAMLYSFIAVILCGISWFYMTWLGKNKAPLSNLVKAEAMQYGVDTLLSLGILLGFFTAYVSQKLGYCQYAKRMDSLIVMIVVLILLRLPFLNLVRGIKDLLFMTPEQEYDKASLVLSEITSKWNFEDYILRIGKGGKCLYCSIFIIASTPEKTISFEEMDSIRRDIKEQLHNSFANPIHLNVSFIHDKKIIETTKA